MSRFYYFQTLSSVPPSSVAPNNINYSSNSPNISPSSDGHQYLRNSNPSHNEQTTLIDHSGPGYPLTQHLQR